MFPFFPARMVALMPNKIKELHETSMNFQTPMVFKNKEIIIPISHDAHVPHTHMHKNMFTHTHLHTADLFTPTDGKE